jgi:hypothetical protein
VAAKHLIVAEIQPTAMATHDMVVTVEPILAVVAATVDRITALADLALLL